MINKLNYHDNYCNCASHKHCLTEVTRWEMINSGKTKSPDRFLKSKNYSPKDFKNVDFEDLFVNDTFTWSTRVYGEEHYIVTISFEGPFDYLKDTLKGMRGKNRYKRITVDLLAKALSVCLDTEDLFVDCSCPDFLYRFSFWATQADCKYGTPQLRAPTVRNVKNNKGYVCKHILAILYGKRWVQSAARAWYEYVQANPELSEYYIWGEPKKRNNNNNKNNSNNLNNSDDYDDDYYDEDEVELPWAH